MKITQGGGVLRMFAVGLIVLLSIVTAGCSNLFNSGSESSGGSPTVPGVDTITTELGTTFTYDSLSWETVSGTAGLNSDGYLVVKAPTEGIAVELTAGQWSTLASAYGDSFYIEAVLLPTVAGSGSNKNFGIASHISTDNKAFYYGGINFNGRAQLGALPNIPKGMQFGSLISDASYLKVESNWTQYYTIRYEYNNGTITGYINGIRFNKAGTTDYTIPTAGVSSSPVSAGIYTNGDTFVMKSFKVGTIDTGYASIKLQSDSTDFVTLTENTTKYIFLPEPSVTVNAGDDPVTYTVTALDDSGTSTTFTAVSSDSSVVSVAAEDTTLTVTPAGTGTATVTITNGSDSSVTRVIDYTVEASLSYTDTDYGDYSAFYPVPEATGIYEDDHLAIAFDSTPTLVDGAVGIYASDGTLVDSVDIGSDADTIGGTTYTLKNFMIQVVGNQVIIKPHTGKLSNGTTYYVAIPDGVITGTVNGKTFTGFDTTHKRWSFTTRSSYTPTNTSRLVVGTVAADSTETADYRTLQAAIEASSDGAIITVEPGTYYEIINYTGSNALTIKGAGSKTYGTDVVIKGINCNSYNGSSATRAAIHWAGGNLTLENLTLQNAYDRNVDGTAQSEALYFDTDSYLAAYNCSFLGHQDTLLTKGRNWFYKCYVEGDTDFIWGYADVCLLEECKLKMLDTSSDKVAASKAIIFETRVSSDASGATTVGKGYVLYNSTLDCEHPTCYFARRASASGSSGSNYYDQAAVIDTTITTGSNGNLDSGLWGYSGSSGNRPVYISKVGGNMNVGWKAYNDTLNGSSLSVPDNNDWAGTITQTLYGKEYNGRNTILNRVYKKTGSYKNASDIWDVSSLEGEFHASKDTSTIGEAGAVEGANGTYDILDLAERATGASSYSQGDSLTDGTSSDGYVSWTDLLYHSSGYGVYTKTGSSISITVAGKSVIGFTGSTYSNGTLMVTDSSNNTVLNSYSTKLSMDKSSFSFLYTTDTETTLTLAFTGTTYINNLVISELTDEEVAVTDVTLSGAATVAVGSSITVAASVSGTYCPDTSVTWSTSDKDIATVSDGVVTGVSAGEVTITATSVQTPGVSDSKNITVSSGVSSPVSGMLYTYDLTGGVGTPYTSDDGFLSVSASSDNSSHGLVMKADNYFTLQVLANAVVTLTNCIYDNNATITVTNSSGTTVGTISVTEGAATDGVTQDWTYSGSADTLTFTYTAADGQTYLHGVAVQD